MIKNKGVLIVTLILFLLVNTNYYWEGLFGGWNMLIFLIFVIGFLVLSGCLFYHIFLVIKEKFKDRSRIYLIGCMSILLGLIAWHPRGVVDFEKFEENDLFVAGRGGVANCTTTLKLKQKNQFYIRSVCFGIDKVSGTYTVNKDTVKFKFSPYSSRDDRFMYGIIKITPVKYQSDKGIGEIQLYKSVKDTVPFSLVVFKNALIK